MADEQQDLLQEGWQAHDLRSGVAKVYAEAKRRNTMGIRVTAIWAVMLLLFGTIDMTGAANVAPPLWDFFAGGGLILLSALAMSRAPGSLLGAGATSIIDLVVVAYGLPELIDGGTAVDYTCLAMRVVLAPFAIFFIMNGYFGALSIQAFKQGFSPGADWRTRINPAMMQFVIICSCIGALFLGVAVWTGAIMTGFAQTNVVWITRTLLKKPIEVKVARTLDVEEAKTDGEQPGVFANINVLKAEKKKPGSIAVKIPETAKPITSLAGLDDFMKAEVEEAYEFAEDADDAGCLAEAQGRQDRCRDDRCRYWSRVFARACLVKGKKTEHFCDNVPSPQIPDAGMTWAQRLCAGRAFEICREMLFAVQGHCHPDKLTDVLVPGDPADGDKSAAATPPDSD